jgi:hypothetical protein
MRAEALWGVFVRSEWDAAPGNRAADVPAPGWQGFASIETDFWRQSPMTDVATHSITCPRYERTAQGKRCVHYQDGGRCARARGAQSACVEWLKVNGRPVGPGEKEPLVAQSEPVDRDLFGNPLPVDQSRRVARRKPATETHATAPVAPATTPTASTAPPKPPLVRNVTDEEVASFKELGTEVCIRSAEIGDVWVVPEYTGVDRRELSVEHSITLATICAVFPGAKVVSMTAQAAADDQERS